MDNIQKRLIKLFNIAYEECKSCRSIGLASTTGCEGCGYKEIMKLIKTWTIN